MSNEKRYEDVRKLKAYVNAEYDIKELYARVMGRNPGTGKCFCPFHHNTDTPAAKIYDQSLKCFGECNRLFTSFDFLKEFFPDELDSIKRTVILPETVYKEKSISQVLKRSELDLSQPMDVIITKILKYNLLDYKTPTEQAADQLSIMLTPEIK